MVSQNIFKLNREWKSTSSFLRVAIDMVDTLMDTPFLYGFMKETMLRVGWNYYVGHYFLSCNIMFKRIFNGVHVREALLLYVSSYISEITYRQGNSMKHYHKMSTKCNSSGKWNSLCIPRRVAQRWSFSTMYSTRSKPHNY